MIRQSELLTCHLKSDQCPVSFLCEAGLSDKINSSGKVYNAVDDLQNVNVSLESHCERGLNIQNVGFAIHIFSFPTYMYIT